MFRAVPLSTIRSFSLFTQQEYMSYRFTDSLRAGSGRKNLSFLAYYHSYNNYRHATVPRPSFRCQSCVMLNMCSDKHDIAI